MLLVSNEYGCDFCEQIAKCRIYWMNIKALEQNPQHTCLVSNVFTEYIQWLFYITTPIHVDVKTTCHFQVLAFPQHFHLINLFYKTNILLVHILLVLLVDGFKMELCIFIETSINLYVFF